MTPPPSRMPPRCALKRGAKRVNYHDNDDSGGGGRGAVWGECGGDSGQGEQDDRKPSSPPMVLVTNGKNGRVQGEL